jgi:hypothetical protein
MNTDELKPLWNAYKDQIGKQRSGMKTNFWV